ncbi:MAG: alternate F1F0 ATPase, F1 subunit alpha [bacterium]
MSKEDSNTGADSLLEGMFGLYDDVLGEKGADLKVEEVGEIVEVGEGTAYVRGLPNVRSDELLRFPGGRMGMAFNLEEDRVAVILLDHSDDIDAGDQVSRTNRILDVPVGEGLLGRIVDPLGRPLDDGGPIAFEKRLPIERPAAAIMDRSPVNVPLQTGIQVIDALIPIGRGQRELILGDRQTGKSAIAIDTIINQIDKDVISVYCAIGKEVATVAKVVEDFRRAGVLDRCVIVIATGEDPPGLKYVAPYAATSIAEYFMEQGKDALVVYDDLTRHAWAYRELSLLLRRPPAREAYPGDIFYIHSRLLERSTHMREDLGGGSLTALPIVETQAQNMSAYIPTNLISITDGQVYLSPKLFHEGILPAVDVGKSVSRVGGKTQLTAYRMVAGDLRLSYSQFEELETFARFGTRLDEDTQKTLERGRRVREVLKQAQFKPIPVPEQIGVLMAVTEGVLDSIPVKQIEKAKTSVRKAIRERLGDIAEKILRGEKLEESEVDRIIEIAKDSLDWAENADS